MYFAEIVFFRKFRLFPENNFKISSFFVKFDDKPLTKAKVLEGYYETVGHHEQLGDVLKVRAALTQRLGERVKICFTG